MHVVLDIILHIVVWSFIVTKALVFKILTLCCKTLILYYLCCLKNSSTLSFLDFHILMLDINEKHLSSKALLCIFGFVVECAWMFSSNYQLWEYFVTFFTFVWLSRLALVEKKKQYSVKVDPVMSSGYLYRILSSVSQWHGIR